ncbi:MAG: hypothetical protein AAF401_17280 [Pseudomonadota bacterium]
MIRILTFITALAVSFPAVAGECPEISRDETVMAQLHDDLLSAETEMAGRAIGDQLWRIWTTAPDEQSQSLLDQGRERIRVADYSKAEAFFGDLIDYCPHYAEGWNQRAYVRFLQQNYGAALEDIDQALMREPRHFGALAGRSTVLINMGRPEVGYTALREALKVNPWLSERHLLPPEEKI